MIVGQLQRACALCVRKEISGCFSRIVGILDMIVGQLQRACALCVRKEVALSAGEQAQIFTKPSTTFFTAFDLWKSDMAKRSDRST